ncbi:unnamed protein product [Peronospora belbahrii]|uniref:Uncharacterized protein n=1 Tax=Peronospora belbahrii TaxID=622444 RepID=A0AAU9L8D0_9STRA|nr:unnamed protein product [Peronospora belbahrii]
MMSMYVNGVSSACGTIVNTAAASITARFNIFANRYEHVSCTACTCGDLIEWSRELTLAAHPGDVGLVGQVGPLMWVDPAILVRAAQREQMANQCTVGQLVNDVWGEHTAVEKMYSRCLKAKVTHHVRMLSITLRPAVHLVSASIVSIALGMGGNSAAMAPYGRAKPSISPASMLATAAISAALVERQAVPGRYRILTRLGDRNLSDNSRPAAGLQLPTDCEAYLEVTEVASQAAYRSSFCVNLDKADPGSDAGASNTPA